MKNVPYGSGFRGVTCEKEGNYLVVRAPDNNPYVDGIKIDMRPEITRIFLSENPAVMASDILTSLSQAYEFGQNHKARQVRKVIGL